MADELKSTLTGLVTAAAQEHGYELVLLELGGARHNPLVRVYLDQEGGIGIDAITAANRWIKELLDPLPSFGNGYTLEVSSPGIERPLVTIAHFTRFVGSEVAVSTSVEVEGHKRFTATISGVEGDVIVFDLDGTTVRVPHAAITKARLRARIDFGREGNNDGL